MFLLIGVSGKVRDCGRVQNCTCPVCGRAGTLHVCNKYMTPHIFFIPTFRFHCTYIATCASCASVMELNTRKGKELERGIPVSVSPDDLCMLHNNNARICDGCGERQPPGNVFCGRCGNRL